MKLTNLEKIEADEAKQQRIQDVNNYCQVCKKRFGQSSLQLAHIVSKSKNYIKRFGLEVIHHHDNMVITCNSNNGRCNDSVMLDPDTIPGAEHLAYIENKLYNNK